ncbi:hypothetical protein QFC22_001319 [Naganishia vaughanmartiniae]|uniref:Uncharacterized protein n=1 Tax=Naganishia vaughanmartiniae TaxID=1424756 RepID=A0ACC2XGH8_9TREE|nr:hypothetical protein QFC22_001319 [Naganishia vaughanmartiniae]
MASLSLIRPVGRYQAARTQELTLIIGGFRRGLSNTPRHLDRQVEVPAASKQTGVPKFNSNIPRVIYRGPLTNTFKYLKLFSVSSLVLSSALSPFIFILESSLPLSGRIFLAFTAVSTTTLSTFLISTFTSPYVTSITANPASSPYSHTLTTTSLFLRPRNTLITSPANSLVPSERPMTTWKLRESIENGLEAGQEHGSPQASTVEESVLAITEDEEGNALGRWVVMGMDKSGRQKCQAKGKVVRYFNVHPEILQEPIEVGTGSAET